MKLLFLGTEEDKQYFPKALRFLRDEGHDIKFSPSKVDMLAEIPPYLKQGGFSKFVITTQKQLISQLCNTASAKEQTVDNYAGSWLEDSKSGITYLIVNPLKQCVTKNYGQFLLERYISKITKPSYWLEQDNFNWKLLEHENDYEEAIRVINKAILCAVDIETRRDLSISSISYTSVLCSAGYFTTQTFVVPLPYGLTLSDYQWRFAWIADLNKTLTPKILQGGRYDIAYLNRYNVPLISYLWDTMVCHHCWYSELPKTLDSIAAFYLRKPIYWKHEGDSGNDYDLYQYNALDTWYTAWTFIAWLKMAPRWALDNYLKEFPVMYPCILMEATGMPVNWNIFNEIKAKKETIVKTKREELGRVLGWPNFNPGSWQQVKVVLHALGCKDLPSTDEKNLDKAAYRHPFNHWVIERILDYRGAAKLVSTYLVEEKIFNNYVLYAMLPYGTKTGRIASQEHAFWVGMQIQNIPNTEEGDVSVKSYMVAPPGFKIGEIDYSKNESHTTGYISGDTVLIANVTGDNDFHAANASMFFGIPYEQIAINLPGKVYKILNKLIRQLTKKLNHGKSYNMGSKVLVDTMGLKNIFLAKELLHLPRGYTAIMIADYLGKCFAKTYKILTGPYYKWIEDTVSNTRLLVGATGWTRYCFGNPRTNKPDLNAYIAHPSQSLAAMLLNKAVLRIYNEVWKPNYKNFKMCAQIHDSNLTMYRDGYEHLIDQAADCMVNETEITDIFGNTRIMKVPVDISMGGTSWQDSKDH